MIQARKLIKQKETFIEKIITNKSHLPKFKTDQLEFADQFNLDDQPKFSLLRVTTATFREYHMCFIPTFLLIFLHCCSIVSYKQVNWTPRHQYKAYS